MPWPRLRRNQTPNKGEIGPIQDTVPVEIMAIPFPDEVVAAERRHVLAHRIEDQQDALPDGIKSRFES